jgi:hypothetical protein
MKNVGWLWAENYHPEDYDPDFGTSFDTDPRGWKRVEAGNHPLEDLFFSQKPEVLNKKTAFVVKKFRGKKCEKWVIAAKGTLIEPVSVDHDWGCVCEDFFSSRDLRLLNTQKGWVVSSLTNPDTCLLIPWTVSAHSTWPADGLDVAMHNLEFRFTIKKPDISQILNHFSSILKSPAVVATPSLAVRKRRTPLS